jgi:hypothetical protein
MRGAFHIPLAAKHARRIIGVHGLASTCVQCFARNVVLCIHLGLSIFNFFDFELDFT